MLLASCSDGAARGEAASSATVEIRDYAFAPSPVVVTAGTAVTWVERDPDLEGAGAHTVVADDGTFASAPLKAGETFSFTPAARGDVAYHCGIHNYMTGTISVR